MSSKKLQILVCGGGNGAHCFTGIASSRPNLTVKVLTVYQDEAARWSDALQESEMKVAVSQKDVSDIISSKPFSVTNDPKTAMDGVNIVFLVVPSYVHGIFLTLIKPYIKPNTLIVGLPGHAGFELQCKHIMKEKIRHCAVVGFESLPWACRIVKYGRDVQLLGFKDMLGASFQTGQDCKLDFNAIETIQYIIGPKPVVRVVDNILAVTLMAGSMIHPPIMYGRWKDWDGIPLKEKPLFYQGIDDVQAKLSSELSNELVKTARRIQELQNDLDMNDVIHIYDWYKSHYRDDIADDSNLLTCMKTNSAYNGLAHPMVATERGYVPDFQYRYTSEDIPFGLVVMKGIAETVSIATPVMDEIITWAQNKLEKEYVVNGKLVGTDVRDLRTPQSYGLTTIDQLIVYLNRHMC